MHGYADDDIRKKTGSQISEIGSTFSRNSATLVHGLSLVLQLSPIHLKEAPDTTREQEWHCFWEKTKDLSCNSIQPKPLKLYTHIVHAHIVLASNHSGIL